MRHAAPGCTGAVDRMWHFRIPISPDLLDGLKPLRTLASYFRQPLPPRGDWSLIWGPVSLRSDPDVKKRSSRRSKHRRGIRGRTLVAADIAGHRQEPRNVRQCPRQSLSEYAVRWGFRRGGAVTQSSKFVAELDAKNPW